MIAVYALSNADCENDIYVGSSNNINKRMGQHKDYCNNVKARGYNRKLYTFIREHGGWEKWQYHIIEEFDVYDKMKLKEREDYWMVELRPTLNCCRARRTKKQHYIDNKEEISKKQIKYYEKNKKEINKRNNIYGKKYRASKDAIAKLSAPNWCECGGVYSYGRKARHYKSKRCREYMASIISPSAPPSL